MGDVRVLIVDDQEPFRRAMTAVVAATDGFVVTGTATTGEESLAAAAELRPDLVLMDVNLPGLDGVAATRRLTAAPDAPVVLLLSTYDVDQVDIEGSGAVGFLAKADLGPDQLSAVWQEALGARSQGG